MSAYRRSTEEVRARVESVPDPELPMIGLGDLGVVHSVAPDADGVLEVQITPTFLGCPALPAITSAVEEVLAACGHPDGRVRQVLAPAWTTERITPAGRRKLAAHGIAPPVPADATGPGGPVTVALGSVPCPHCGSRATRPHSAFGATRCQSVLRCTACRETFPHMSTV
ncbi:MULTISPECIES: 1,2-phenylacetyl-CoA epoxidase subunit PaaD [Streptomyces]|uniref:1,2-phenylacetyl-CoA epoxidase subunit PaaD n=1 Tax=Streptomyces doudnae TaxID=3075536 RepID=A0ABD5EPQ4_9ACTN|nr:MULTISPECIES: 1,2-phenylacetyl-CoA epoxidase subunit PaaD [unclassified Streptomyces]MDT0436305.1 1,2-phenylacetyl-CoA epoxidase subunit PaaD [Streptomyces sp. DSM 41981]MYQ65260.1 phenylacetate-CoA oxygenase subunit PaaJ [Streptomyces sp. SID4950]SCD95944.1 ring-1,2-phenylacetyl-CoA epoxidase subunit PaaD [Streptomyces sp. SolWspMP-5a-2]